MPHRAVVFDLDGTLLNSLADIGDAANTVLGGFGLPPHPVDRYKDFIGEGVARLFQRALPEDRRGDDHIERCGTAFQTAYSHCWNRKSKLYPGVGDLLDFLRERGYPAAVLSNKPDAFTKKCVDHFLSYWSFAAVAGEKPPIPRKPDPQGAILMARQLGLAPSEILYLGDTPVDMQTARNAGMTPIGVSWGFRPVAELYEHGAAAVISKPLEAVRWMA